MLTYRDVERTNGEIFATMRNNYVKQITQEELEIFMTDLTMLMNKCSSILLEIAGEDQD